MNFNELLNFSDIQFMPVMENKQPIEKGWQNTSKKYSLSNCKAVGMVCGKLSASENGSGIEVIDIDCKYDLTGKLYENYKRLIQQYDKSLLRKLVVQSTKGGGYHFIYRCSTISGNLKLAQRPISEGEKQTEFKLLKVASPNEKDEVLLKRISKVKVLLETRGEGGYVVCFPSKGYELIHGDFYGIKEITVEERDALHSIARQFNEVFVEYVPKYKNPNPQLKGLSPFEDYNERSDVIGLLESHGWKAVKTNSSKTFLLRPGQTTASHSGNYDHVKKWFSVFTTSSEFEPTTPYLPYAVYAVLECQKDFKKASEDLYNLGYGDRHERTKEINEKTPSKINTLDDDYSFLATAADYDAYLELAKAGKIPQGLTTGMKELDKFFLFKKGDMVMANGGDNVGKTAAALFLIFMSSLLHKWTWILYTAENSIGSVTRRMIEYYWCKKIDKLTPLEFKIAKDFFESHFAIIKTEEELHNYKDIINMTKKLMKRKDYSGVFIDPYNSLKMELNNASKLNSHEYHYEAISELKMFGKKNEISMWVNHHVVTGALRTKDAEGYIQAPGKADTEGGAKIGNKTDQFITYHRHVNHPTEWMWTELHIRKVKETETGGRPTPKSSPVRIRMDESGCGYRVIDEMGFEQNPIFDFHRINKTIQSELNMPSVPEKIWMPYKDEDDSGDVPF